MAARLNWKKLNDEWAKDSKGSKPKSAPHKQIPGECLTYGCRKPAEKDSYCMGCWMAIFGGVI